MVTYVPAEESSQAWAGGPSNRGPAEPHLRLAALPPALDLDLPAWLDCYLADCEARGVTSKTLDWYGDRGRRIVGSFGAAGIHRPKDITRSAVSELIGRLRNLQTKGKRLEPQTILGYWQVGKGFITFLKHEGAFEGPNPFDQFGKPMVRPKAMWAPSMDECRAMLKVPDRKTVRGLRDVLLLFLMLDTGLRVSALRAIRVMDIDIPERKVGVVEKGGRMRFLPVGVQTLRWLRRYLSASRLTVEEYLFPGKTGRPLSRKRIDEIVKSCASRAGVRQGRVSPHDFRRAFSREFLRNGGDLESLRQLLGHSSYAMVKRYAQLASETVVQQHRKASPGDRLCL